jgi:hypothetical protein
LDATAATTALIVFLLAGSIDYGQNAGIVFLKYVNVPNHCNEIRRRHLSFEMPSETVITSKSQSIKGSFHLEAKKEDVIRVMYVYWP